MEKGVRLTDSEVVTGQGEHSVVNLRLELIVM